MDFHKFFFHICILFLFIVCPGFSRNLPNQATRTADLPLSRLASSLSYSDAVDNERNFSSPIAPTPVSSLLNASSPDEEILSKAETSSISTTISANATHSPSAFQPSSDDFTSNQLPSSPTSSSFSSSSTNASQTTAHLGYEQLLFLEGQCGTKNSCVAPHHVCNQSDDHVYEFQDKRQCACDRRCLLYGDCCLDAPIITASIRNLRPTQPTQSRPLVFDDPAHEVLFQASHLLSSQPTTNPVSSVETASRLEDEPVDPDLPSLNPFEEATEPPVQNGPNKPDAELISSPTSHHADPLAASSSHDRADFVVPNSANLTAGWRLEEMVAEFRVSNEHRLDASKSIEETFQNEFDRVASDQFAKQLQRLIGEQFLDQLQHTNQYRADFECAHVSSNKAYFYMRSKCPTEWQIGPVAALAGATTSDQVEDVRHRCEQAGVVGRLESDDPIGETPVTSLGNWITYRNIYCAICNQHWLEQQVIQKLPTFSHATTADGKNLSYEPDEDDHLNNRSVLRMEGRLVADRKPEKRHLPPPSAEARVAPPQSKLSLLQPTESEVSADSHSSSSFLSSSSMALTHSKSNSLATPANSSSATSSFTDWRQQLIFWQLNVTCSDTNRFLEYLSPLQLEQLIRNQISRDPSATMWNIEFKSVQSDLLVSKCELKPYAPDQLQEHLRHCRPKLRNECASDWPTDEQRVRALCSAYQAPVYYRRNGTYYSNMHCAQCNHVSSRLLNCAPQQPKTYDEEGFLEDILEGRTPIGGMVSSFAVIFDVNMVSSGGSNVVGEQRMCNGQADLVYDPFRRTCRSVLCVTENSHLVNGVCVQKATPTLNNNFLKEEEITVNAPTSTASSVESIHLNTTITELNWVDNNQTQANVSKTVVPITENGIVENKSLLSRETTGDCQKIAHTDQLIYHISSVLKSDHFKTCAKLEMSPDEYLLLKNDSIYLLQLAQLLQPNEYDFISLNRSTMDNEPINSNHTNSSNDSSSVNATSSVLPSVLICVPPSFYEAGLRPKFDSPYELIVFGSLLLSIICLLLHLLLFSSLSELRNLSGLNLCSMSTALLGAYISIICTQYPQLTNHYTGCLLLSLTKYYFLMASFTWMSVIAFDIYRTIRGSLRCFKYSSGAQLQRFLLYSLFGWLLPAVATILLHALHAGHLSGLTQLLDPIVTLILGASSSVSDVDASTSNASSTVMLLGTTPHCWISSRRALFAAFVAPVGAALLVNLVLFLATARHLINTGRQASALQAKAAALHFGLYARLALLMGLGWLIGLAAAALDQPLLWALFTACNSLQGVFIFLAFSCKPSVLHKLRTRICCCWPSQTIPSHRHRDMGDGFNDSSRRGSNRVDPDMSGISPCPTASNATKSSSFNLSQ